MNIDKELRDQQSFDETPFSDEDKKLYTLLMSELDTESDLVINPSFSAEVIKKLEAKKRKEARWEFLLFFSAIAGVILLVTAAFSFLKNTATESFAPFRNSPLIPVMVLIVVIIIFQVIDKRYIKDTRIKKRLKQV